MDFILFAIVWAVFVTVMFTMAPRRRYRFSATDPLFIAMITAPFIFSLLFNAGIIDSFLGTTSSVVQPVEDPEVVEKVEDLVTTEPNITKEINENVSTSIVEANNVIYETDSTEFDFNQITI